MAKLVYALNQSLDGFVDHERLMPDTALFRHFVDHVRDVAGLLYGRRTYDVMRYWDDDVPDWNDEERAYAAVWRPKRKWVVSHAGEAVGPGATLVAGDVGSFAQGLKSQYDGEIDVAGPELARYLTERGLIDEYRLYLHPVVLGGGKPFFAGPRPPLRLIASERISENVARLSYVPAN